MEFSSYLCIYKLICWRNTSADINFGVESVSTYINNGKVFKLSLWVVILALIEMHGYKGCLKKERIDLLKIKSFFISASDKEYADNILNSWVDNPISNCCHWEGVECNHTTRRVIELSVYNTRQTTYKIYDNYSKGFPILDFFLFSPFQELQSLDFIGLDFLFYGDGPNFSSIVSKPN